MNSLTLLPIIIYSYFLIINFISIPPVYSSDELNMWYHNCSGSMYTNGSTYQTNLKSALSLITNQSLQITNKKFYNSSVGQEPNRVNAIGWCRKDIPSDDCSTCLNTSTYNLLKSCPIQRVAIAWYTDCMFRYSDQEIVGKEETDPIDHMISPATVNNSDLTQFNEVVGNLYWSLADTATTGDDPQLFAAWHQHVDGFSEVYAMVECTPDISARDCSNCLTAAISEVPHCCNTAEGRRVLMPSCFIRSEVSLFYNLSFATPPILPPNEGCKKLKRSIFIYASVAVSLIAFLNGVTCIALRRRHQRSVPDDIKLSECSQFDYRTLTKATNNFASANRLGRGGFGVVYKGELSDGQEIAVKRLSRQSEQGDPEFKNEVLLMARIQHRNLVRLLGFCLHKEERLLVYEFIPNASLDRFLFDPTKRDQLDWEARNKIIEGTARGLQYLHEDSRFQIVHRDLKPSNVLLDGDMNAKIADFGMARLFHGNQTHADTENAAGTRGYMAPEYVLQGKISIKSDVYSFGVLVLEVISGQRNTTIDEEDSSKDLLSTAWKSWNKGSLSNLVDRTLLLPGSVQTQEVMRCLQIALLCVQEDISQRPTMSSVLAMLNNDQSFSLPLPSLPPCFISSSVANYSLARLPHTRDES